jgi:hypothetical protein
MNPHVSPHAVFISGVHLFVDVPASLGVGSRVRNISRRKQQVGLAADERLPDSEGCIGRNGIHWFHDVASSRRIQTEK